MRLCVRISDFAVRCDFGWHPGGEVDPIPSVWWWASSGCCGLLLRFACVARSTCGLAVVGVELGAAGRGVGDVVDLGRVADAAGVLQLAAVVVAVEHLEAEFLPGRGSGDGAADGALALP